MAAGAEVGWEAGLCVSGAAGLRVGGRLLLARLPEVLSPTGHEPEVLGCEAGTEHGEGCGSDQGAEEEGLAGAAGLGARVEKEE